MAQSVTVIDYGIVNLGNIVRALQFVGAKVKVTDCPSQVIKGSRIVLPGVGSFSAGMSMIGKKGLDEAIVSASKSLPLMGICLGMQMLFEKSSELGEHKGLGIFKGEVVPIRGNSVSEKQRQLKVPHVGWREFCSITDHSAWQKSCLGDLTPNESVYFVHSFMAKPTYTKDVLAQCKYGKNLIVAATASNGTVGLQFHPERSGPAGLKVLRRFVHS
ncbi:MAG: imidazole glycerol phosphate synthase subunit HisH [Luminiphilus sp.]|nr:imidazole glycerol phosphate synthase subunit HisH [Luminiphilus sp.]